MRLIGLVKLDDFKRGHPTVRKALDAWIIETKNAKWKAPQCIKDRYRTADFLSENRVIFNIKGNSYRLVVRVSYAGDTVVIEWIGTHAEYDKKKF